MKTRRYAINTAVCCGCGACAKACPRKAIKIDMGNAQINYDLCDTCGSCAAACKLRAISLKHGIWLS